METIFETFTRTVCANCKNKECKEELRRRIDGSIKCDEYERNKEEYKDESKSNKQV